MGGTALLPPHSRHSTTTGPVRLAILSDVCPFDVYTGLGYTYTAERSVGVDGGAEKSYAEIPPNVPT